MHREAYLKRFKEITNEMLELTTKKNQDYCSNEDAFANFKLVENLGICSAEVGILVRMCDKISRISRLMKAEAKVKDESIDDTNFDLCVYGIILQIYREAKRNGTD